MRRSQTIACLLALAAVAAPSLAAADIFKLVTGGEVRGELINKGEDPRKTYQIKTYLGVNVMLEADQVTEVDEQRENEVEYEKLRLKAPETVEAHLKLADWCDDHYLYDEKEHHLRKALELDHEQPDARRLLRYQKVDGRWMTHEEKMESQGFVYYNNRWRTPQEVQLIEERTKAEESENRWRQQVDRWVDNLDHSRRGPESLRSLEAIDDVAAAPALAEQLKRSRDYRHKRLLAEILMKLNTQFSVAAVVEASVQDENEDFRYDCLDLMEKYRPPTATALYIKGLNKKYENHLINRAAKGLQRLKDPRAVGPLIDALVTQHRRQIGGGGGAGSIGTSFGRGSDGSLGPTGLSMGEGPKTVTEHLRNESVLDALTEITGQDFHYDIDAWRFWHARQNRVPDVIPGRRD